MKIPAFAPGRSGPQIFSASDMNVLVRSLNALLNVKIQRGAWDNISITEQGTIFQLGPNQLQS